MVALLSRIPASLRQWWGTNLLLVVLLAAALALRLYGIDWDAGHGFHPDERSFYMRAGDMLCLLTASPEKDGPYCSAAHLRSMLDGEHFAGVEPGRLNFWTALSAERSPLNPRWFPLGSVLIYALVLLRTLLEPFADWGVMELRFVGRTLAALADVGSVWLLYLIGRRMYGRWTGILAAAFAAFAVIHIQHAHYYRPEPFTVLASLGCVVGDAAVHRHRTNPPRRVVRRVGGLGHGAQSIGSADTGAAGAHVPLGSQRPRRTRLD